MSSDSPIAPGDTPPRALDPLFNPKSVAVIGASEKAGSVGRTIFWNLIRSPFGGTVHAVNPARRHVLGIKAYPTIAAIGEKVDLAVIITPAHTVPGVVRECVDLGVKGAIIISAGFKETGEAGIALEQSILAEARKGGMRIIGPNCLGLMNPITGLNATFASAMAHPGSVGFISQSGALCTAILDWSFQAKVGFSAFVSIGSMLDVNWGDLIFYLGDDPHTKSIVIYMESIGDARSFLSAAREVSLDKPIIVIKAGKTEAAAKAAASHTGSLAGSDEVLSAAFRRSGVLRVSKISRLFHLADVLGKQPRPKGPRLTIVTNAGGPGVLATDALIVDGGQLAELSPETIGELNKILPAHWSHDNPIDILGDAEPERYARALEAAARDDKSDGMLVVLTPQAMTDPTRTAEALKSVAAGLKKPVLASWMGGAEVEAGSSILAASNVPVFDFPDTAAEVFNSMWRYSYNLRGIYETPSMPAVADQGGPDRALVERIINDARTEGISLLPEHSSKAILAAYGIPVVPTAIAVTEEEAVGLADQYGYPVVCKLYSKTITHKTDVGGVRLSLPNADAVRQAFTGIRDSVAEKAGVEHFQGVAVQPMIRFEGYEIILGSSVDAQFGPVLLFGSGGQLVEVYKDRALGLPPLNSTLARRMMEQTDIYHALLGVRGRKPVDLAALEQLMVQFSHLVVEQPWIKEIDINPLLASADRLLALDARVVLHGPEVKKEDLPRLAIRPYPIEYASEFTLQNDMPVKLRPIRPEDEPMMSEFHRTLSDDTVYYRFLGLLALDQRIRHDRLTKLCFIDYDRQIALVAEYRHPATGRDEILGVGRIIRVHDSGQAEYAIVISDAVQGQGLGAELLSRLISVARIEGIKQIVGTVLPDNQGMRGLCRKFGFKETKSAGEPVTVTLDL